MIRVIINADDLGISANVNEAIRICFEKGYITNTTLMVNMPDAQDALQIARDGGFFDKIGLHIDITEGNPITDAMKPFDCFCNANGSFNANFHNSTISRLWLSAAKRRAMATEVGAQLEQYEKLGLSQWHLDSHHHSHTDYSTWKVLGKMALSAGMKSVRISRNIFEEGGTSLFNRIYKKFFNAKLKRSGMEVADYFGSFADFVASYDKLADKGDALVEIMVHPMIDKAGNLVDTDHPMKDIMDFLEDKNIVLQSY